MTTDPIACNLVGAEVDAQVGAWRALAGALQRSAAVEGGLSLWFTPAVEAAVREVAATEAACCPFLRLDVVVDGSSTRLDITSAHAEALPMIQALGDLVGAR